MAKYGELAPLAAGLSAYTRAAREGDIAAKERILRQMEAASRAVTSTAGILSEQQRLKMLQAAAEREQAISPSIERQEAAKAGQMEFELGEARRLRDQQVRIEELVRNKRGYSVQEWNALGDAAKAQEVTETIDAALAMGAPRAEAGVQAQERMLRGVTAAKGVAEIREEARAEVPKLKAEAGAAKLGAEKAGAEYETEKVAAARKYDLAEAEASSEAELARLEPIMQQANIDLAKGNLRKINQQIKTMEETGGLEALSPSQRMQLLIYNAKLGKAVEMVDNGVVKDLNTAVMRIESMPEIAQAYDDLNAASRAKSALLQGDEEGWQSYLNTAPLEEATKQRLSADRQAAIKAMNALIRQHVGTLGFYGIYVDINKFISPDEGVEAPTTTGGPSGIISDFLKKR